MRKTFTLLLLFATCISGIKAQNTTTPDNSSTENVFDKEDLDENGWLWFDTPEKIEKYVEESKDGKINPNGKIFQYYSTEVSEQIQGPYNKSFASDTIVGYCNPKGDGSDKKIGAISLHPAVSDKLMGSTPNGGILFINLPSCSSMNFYMSASGAAICYFYGTNDAEQDTSKYSCVYKPQYFDWGFFKQYEELFRSNSYQWLFMENLNDNGNSTFKFKSENPVYGMLKIANHVTPVYIHGVKILKNQSTTNISNISGNDDFKFDGYNIRINESSDIFVYNMNGVCVMHKNTNILNVERLVNGIYIAKINGKCHKFMINR